jgi:hypothetical protein
MENSERMREIHASIIEMVLPRPSPHAALEKSPKPSTEMTMASLIGET